MGLGAENSTELGLWQRKYENLMFIGACIFVIAEE